MPLFTRAMMFLVRVGCPLLAMLSLATAQNSAAPPLLRTVAEVRALTREEAATARPARIEGIVTYYEPAWFLTFIQDSTGGIYVSAEGSNLHPGDRVIVEGVSAPGSAGRILLGSSGKAVSVHLLGHGDLPPPRTATPAQLEDATFDAQWVSVHGLIRTVQRSNDRAALQLEAEGHSLRVLLPGYGENRDLPGYLRNIPVTVSGVLGSSVSEAGEPSTYALLVPSEAHVIPDPAFLSEQFSRPSLRFSELFSVVSGGEDASARLSGIVTFVRPGRGFFMGVREGTDWGGTIWVQTSQPLNLRPGQLVDVLGVPEMNNRRPLLHNALVRPGEQRTPWSYTRLSSDEGSPETQGQLVVTEGTLLEQRHGWNEEFLVMSTGRSVFCVRLESSAKAQALPAFEKGSRVEVRGVYVNTLPDRPAPPPQPFTFEVWAQDATDVTLLARPAWWTFARVAWALSATAVFALLAIAWAVSLRRKVQAQTEVIRQQLQRETVHRERTRIARDFHDTLEQHFAALNIQLDTIAATASGAPPQLHTLVRDARELARHSQQEARHVIWELRSSALGAGKFAGVLEEKLRPVAERAGLDFHFSVEGTPPALPGTLENHLLRIAQEALTNTLKHAGATRMDVQLLFKNEEVVLRIRDNGRGLPETSGGSGHFGLCGMRERADRLNGRFDIRNAPEGGVVIAVHVPLTQALATPQ